LSVCDRTFLSATRSRWRRGTV